MLETELGIIIDSCHAGMYVNASFCVGKYALSLFEKQQLAPLYLKLSANLIITMTLCCHKYCIMLMLRYIVAHLTFRKVKLFQLPI